MHKCTHACIVTKWFKLGVDMAHPCDPIISDRFLPRHELLSMTAPTCCFSLQLSVCLHWSLPLSAWYVEAPPETAFLAHESSKFSTISCLVIQLILHNSCCRTLQRLGNLSSFKVLRRLQCILLVPDGLHKAVAIPRCDIPWQISTPDLLHCSYSSFSGQHFLLQSLSLGLSWLTEIHRRMATTRPVRWEESY